jgi:hypothetical protein
MYVRGQDDPKVRHVLLMIVAIVPAVLCEARVVAVGRSRVALSQSLGGSSIECFASSLACSLPYRMKPKHPRAVKKLRCLRFQGR